MERKRKEAGWSSGGALLGGAEDGATVARCWVGRRARWCACLR
uniref:Uncharacterized protein n=1 Tax=Arundo donax TaxID=35708 RepID=A0A0A8XP78_ARUDO